ncbi:hypothetical protein Psuf_036870 [Phytohabitans suffuscus]|uniref:Uncharacterized protein n=1 Tax=Phytohabitans suffuscus TaxID=624315 RepID=A0A6F8YJR8_9ACTN|nr:hypothetical protein Psuf_036870 [Phytohabitans suffuscus]
MAGQRGVQRQLVRGEEQQLGDRDREVAVGQLDQQAVAKLPVVAEEGERVLVAAPPLDLARVREQQPRRAELVEGDVGEGDVLLHLRRAGVPLGEALRRDQRVVADLQQAVGVHRCCVPSGTS